MMFSVVWPFGASFFGEDIFGGVVLYWVLPWGNILTEEAVKTDSETDNPATFEFPPAPGRMHSRGGGAASAGSLPHRAEPFTPVQPASSLPPSAPVSSSSGHSGAALPGRGAAGEAAGGQHPNAFGGGGGDGGLDTAHTGRVDVCLGNTAQGRCAHSPKVKPMSHFDLATFCRICPQQEPPPHLHLKVAVLPGLGGD